MRGCHAAILLGTLLAAAPALAQTPSTRSALETQNNVSIKPNNVGAITPALLNSLIGNVIASTGTLLDQNTFAQPPIYTGQVGFAYANGSNPLTFSSTIPAATLSGLGSGVPAALVQPINGASGLVGYSGQLGTPLGGNLANMTGYLASALSGSTLAAGVTGSSLLGVGALATGSTTTGFTIGSGTTFTSGPRIPAPNLAPNSAASSELSITLSTQPTYNYPENASSCSTEFNGDFSKTLLPLCYNVGSAALGTQTAGYFWNPATTPHDDMINMAGGFSGGSGVTEGRTGWVDYATLIQHTGQGDAGMLRFFGAIQAPMNAGETNFLQGKAIFALAADLNTGIAGGYEQGIGDFNFNDDGFETGVVGTSYRFNRTVNTTTYGSVWIAENYHSVGSKAIDCAWCLSGPAVVGLDTVNATGLSAAVNLGPDQIISLNSSASAIGGINWYGNILGNATISFVSAASAIEINNIGTSLQILTTQVQTNGIFVAGGVINAIGGFYANSVKGCSGTVTGVTSTTYTFGIVTAVTSSGGTCT